MTLILTLGSNFEEPIHIRVPYLHIKFDRCEDQFTQ